MDYIFVAKVITEVCICCFLGLVPMNHLGSCGPVRHSTGGVLIRFCFCEIQILPRCSKQIHLLRKLDQLGCDSSLRECPVIYRNVTVPHILNELDIRLRSIWVMALNWEHIMKLRTFFIAQSANLSKLVLEFTKEDFGVGRAALLFSGSIQVFYLPNTYGYHTISQATISLLCQTAGFTDGKVRML